MPTLSGPPADDAEACAVAALFADPATYPGHVEKVEVIETHAASVYLAGDEAYKVKKRVSLPFLDFTTLEARHEALSRELALNQPHAPAIYLGLVPIVRERSGGLRLGGEGEIVDWALRMRRFAQEALLARRADKGPLPDGLCAALAAMAAQYHRTSPIAEGIGGAEVMAPVVEQLTSALDDTAGAIDQSLAGEFSERLAAMFAFISPLLTERGRTGAVRRCHGDLHLGNIVLIEGAPVPFDALEFSEKLATIDVLYDLAFLLMDLDCRGDRHAANVVLNAYVGAEPVGREIEGLACLPLFLGCRAGVRAIVALERARQLKGAKRTAQRATAQDYIASAAAFLSPPDPVLIAIGGLSGTGKSTLAARLASCLGGAPGALHLRSDVERKRLFGVAPTERLGPVHYRPEVSARVYAQLIDKARSALAAGHSAILDAVYARPEERSACEALAREQGCHFAGLWLTAPRETMIARVENRRGDASDADRHAVEEQLAYKVGEMSWMPVDAGGMPSRTLEGAKAALRAANVTLEGRARPRR
jgi:aminoglycoside phosphotransferase family enzyme/predicted kinase